MPRRPALVCSSCGRRRPCPDHGRKRSSAGESRRYGPLHRRMRAIVLREEPICPGYGRFAGKCGRKTAHADHKVALAAGGTYARSNYQAFCARCHSAKTVTEDGGLGNRKRQPAPKLERERVVTIPPLTAASFGRREKESR